MSPVAEIVSVVDVVNVDIIGLIPGRRPDFRNGIHDRDPDATVMETRAAIYDDHGHAVHAEAVCTPEMFVELRWRNAVSDIASAIVPAVMLVFPMPRALTLPYVAIVILRLRNVMVFVFRSWTVMGGSMMIVITLHRASVVVVLHFVALWRPVMVVFVTALVFVTLRTTVMVIIVAVSECRNAYSEKQT